MFDIKKISILLFAILGTLSATASCKRRSYNTNSGTRSDTPSESSSYNLGTYTDECEKPENLGPIPIDLISCAKGEDIPIEIETAQGLKTVLYNNFDKKIRNCARPSMVRMDPDEGQCVPHSKLNVVEGIDAGDGKKVQWVYLCRRIFNRPKESSYYDQTALIGYNPVNGATCFFNGRQNFHRPDPNLPEKATDGNRIPHPKNPESEKFWEDLSTIAKDGCVECHSASPWLVTPFVSQVKRNGIPLLTQLGAKSPYKIVARNMLEAQPQDRSWRLRHLVSPEAKACTGCHRIGDRLQCSRFAPLSIGLKLTEPEGAAGPYLQSWISPKFRTFPGSVWHNVSPTERNLKKFADETAFLASPFYSSALFAQKCCWDLEDKDPGCKWETTNP